MIDISQLDMEWDQGRSVRFRRMRPKMDGRIIEWDESYLYVAYPGYDRPIATLPDDLEFV